jgi:hypothetical protein
MKYRPKVQTGYKRTDWVACDRWMYDYNGG